MTTQEKYDQAMELVRDRMLNGTLEEAFDAYAIAESLAIDLAWEKANEAVNQ